MLGPSSTAACTARIRPEPEGGAGSSRRAGPGLQTVTPPPLAMVPSPRRSGYRPPQGADRVSTDDAEPGPIRPVATGATSRWGGGAALGPTVLGELCPLDRRGRHQVPWKGAAEAVACTGQSSPEAVACTGPRPGGGAGGGNEQCGAGFMPELQRLGLPGQRRFVSAGRFLPGSRAPSPAAAVPGPAPEEYV